MIFELIGWISTLILWSAALHFKRASLHLWTAIAALTRIFYLILLYLGPTGDLARPLIMNWAVMFFVHMYQYIKYKKIENNDPASINNNL